MILWIALAVSVLYSVGLFWLALKGDGGRISLGPRAKSWIYGLSLAVYCTSWTFYGAVGTALSSGWHFLPIYLGPILLFTLGYGIVARTLQLGKSHHSTSIADFLSTRYGKSGAVAALVTIIATVGLLPYVALQLKSVGQTLFALSPDIGAAVNPDDVVLGVAAIMALFSILFGARQIDLTQHNRGMVLTIAAEAIVKMLALLAVALFALLLFAGNNAMQIDVTSGFNDIFHADQFDNRFIVLTLISACAALCLPRQFHMIIVEAQKDKPDRLMRFVFPAYLVLIALVVFPITLAGTSQLSAGQIRPDMLMLALPLSMGADWLAILVFIGGFSAATGMVIVTTVALSGMITNDLIVPLFYRRKTNHAALGQSLLWIRRLTIIGLLFFAYLYYRTISSASTLAGLGTVSFAAVSQFAPGLIGGLFWKQGNRIGMIAGLILGFSAWLALLIVPTYLDANPIVQIAEDRLVSAVIISLALNIAAYVIFSLNSQTNIIDKAQSAAFVTMEYRSADGSRPLEKMRVADYRLLLRQFVGDERSRAAMQDLGHQIGRTYSDLDPADNSLIEMVERQLSGVLGASSARAIIGSTMEGDPIPLEQVVAMFDETSQRLQFSGELLQTAIENIDQGVAVVDNDMQLVAWNSRYVDMFSLPNDLVTIGRPISDLIGYNLRRNGMEQDQVSLAVAKRLDHMRAGRKHAQEREQADGRILRISGNPTPTGGYVTSYSDITADRRSEQALEAKVEERTKQLTDANSALEKATRSKTRFLAAASHDLVQPLNAARLFTSALDEEIGTQQPRAKKLAHDIDRSIEMADRLLRALLDISRLDGGGLQPKISRFSLGPLFDDLRSEFNRVAKEKGLKLHVADTDLWVETDRNLLLSILQNLVSNAVRYTENGSVSLEAKGEADAVDIRVKDTGVGIEKAQYEKIFEEFQQVGSHIKREGAGLGLSISQRIAALLDTAIAVESKLGEGSRFSLRFHQVEPQSSASKPVKSGKSNTSELAGRTVLYIDNDQDALDALSALLERWGCDIKTALGPDEAFEAFDQPPDLVIFDYQLDGGWTGDRLFEKLIDKWQQRPPGILVTAEDTDRTSQAADTLNVERLIKPAPPAALRALVSQLLRKA
ncbi:PAS domain-containing hybrid sensor histidine kinase/response regulator [Sphingorhabdus sp. EL138]|uniref:hybrid sensor histidine kinase/response regulator n=1 Tax=Sphingorhabdus sp. EL138 TaxID=2073156 RepID=UPI000D69D206|nr:PAS domain-containing hybrid sensor histidine kinase/response regulator [Sphingorhabdus sp. EL138]